MGGVGSGTWYRWDKQSTIEETKRVDIRYMRHSGLLKPGYTGSLSWSRGGKPTGNINFICLQDYLQLHFRYRFGNEGDWQSVEQKITFDRTPCHYGGERLWFLCPRCDRRVEVLCSDGPLFLCRHCYKLPYRSQNESKLDRVITRKHELGERIFEFYECGEGWGKKKGVHWKTFERLHAEYQQLETQWAKIVMSHLYRL